MYDVNGLSPLLVPVYCAAYAALVSKERIRPGMMLAACRCSWRLGVLVTLAARPAAGA